MSDTAPYTIWVAIANTYCRNAYHIVSYDTRCVLYDIDDYDYKTFNSGTTELLESEQEDPKALKTTCALSYAKIGACTQKACTFIYV